MQDVQLIHDNCFLYNPDKHWLRPIADEFVSAIQTRLQPHDAWARQIEQVIIATEQ